MDCSVSLRRICSTQNQIVNQVNIFFSADTCYLVLPVSVDCAGVSNFFASSLLMLHFVHHLF